MSDAWDWEQRLDYLHLKINRKKSIKVIRVCRKELNMHNRSKYHLSGKGKHHPVIDMFQVTKLWSLRVKNNLVLGDFKEHN
jgi:hypothetical protein